MLLAAATPVLQNPGFETSPFLQGWTSQMHDGTGHVAMIRADTKLFKEGKQSLLLEASNPADVSAGWRTHAVVLHVCDKCEPHHRGGQAAEASTKERMTSSPRTTAAVAFFQPIARV